MPVSPFKALATFLSASLLSLSASAALYGTIGAGSGTSTFVELDPATGAVVSTMGNVGYLVNGMAYDQTSGTLYAVTSANDLNCPSGLLTINPATGAGTVVGPCANNIAGETPSVLTSDSAGNLYSWLEAGADDLIMWNKAAGTISAPIGNAGLSTAQQSLAFDNSDVLYLLNTGSSLYTISTATGASTSMGPVSGGTGINHHGDFNPADNRLYAIDTTGNGNNPRNINVIDVTTKTVVATLPTVNDLHVLAFAGPVVPPVPQAIPTLSQWAMLITALALGLFGFLSMRRRA